MQSLSSVQTWFITNLSGQAFQIIFFQPSPADHEKYGGDPEHLHKVHIVTRIRSRKGHPLGGKITIKMFRLEKTSTPPVHKNIPSVNTQLQVVKHLIIRIKPLKLPQGLPAEEDVCNACLGNMGVSSAWRLWSRKQVSPNAGALSDLKGNSSSFKDGEKVFLLKYILNNTPPEKASSRLVYLPFAHLSFWCTLDQTHGAVLFLLSFLPFLHLLWKKARWGSYIPYSHILH